MGIRNAISKLAGKVKSEYGYFKRGVRVEINDTIKRNRQEVS